MKEGAEEVLEWIALALLLVIEEFALVAQVLDEFPVAVDVGVEIPQLPGQSAFGLGVAWIRAWTVLCSPSMGMVTKSLRE